MLLCITVRKVQLITLNFWIGVKKILTFLDLYGLYQWPGFLESVGNKKKRSWFGTVFSMQPSVLQKLLDLQTLTTLQYSIFTCV